MILRTFPAPKGNKTREDGFYLIEVIFAIALLAVALTAAYQSQAAISRTQGHISRRVLATRLAAAEMEVLQRLPHAELASMSDQSSEIRRRGLRFTRHLSVTDNGDGSVDVVITVRHLSARYPATVSISNTLLDRKMR